MNRLVIVVDNQALQPGLATEHGLGIWVEWEGMSLLYDTGAGQGLLPNMRALGLDVRRVDAVVLSHGHYDHTGGLGPLLEARAEPLDVWAHPDLFAAHLRAGPSPVDIGPPLPRSAYEAMGARFRWVQEPMWMGPGIGLLAPVPRVVGFEGPSPGLVSVDDSGKVVPDPFRDDLAMVLMTRDGPVVLTGCAHAGVVNILEAVRGFSGQEAVMLVGGTHLGMVEPWRVSATVEVLESREGLKVVAGHCTGAAAGVVAARLGERFTPMGAGMILELGRCATSTRS